MTVALPKVDVRFAAKFLAAALVGIGIGTMVPPEPMAVPGLGSISSLLVGGAGVVAGTGLYTRIPSSSECGCSGDCTCE